MSESNGGHTHVSHAGHLGFDDEEMGPLSICQPIIVELQGRRSASESTEEGPGKLGRPPSMQEWKALPESERKHIVLTWNVYSGEGEPLLSQIVEEFRQAYGGVRGLSITGLANYDGTLVIAVRTNLIFDKRLLPDRYLGLAVHHSFIVTPESFNVFGSYHWAPENYEHLVDTHADAIRRELEQPEISREEMLYALIGMKFEDWVKRCRSWGPGYTNR